MALARQASRLSALGELGRTIDGRFRLDALVGSGSTGHVFRALDTRFNEVVALKVFDPALSRDPRHEGRFRTEVATSLRVRHPNVVEVRDYGRFQDGRLFLCTEYLQGRTLGALLREERWLAPTRACAIVRQVAEALTEAHRDGVVHRDLKPENIFLCRVGKAEELVKILDFGIARFVSAVAVRETLTGQGFVAGTPLYLSPEQGQGLSLDGRSDLYSLGVIFFEMLVGRPPFVADTPVGLATMHVNEPPPTPKMVRPSLALPVELEKLLMVLLQKRPERRPRSAQDLVECLSVVENVLDPLLAAGEGDKTPWATASATFRLSRLQALSLATGASESPAYAKASHDVGDTAAEERAYRELRALLGERAVESTGADEPGGRGVGEAVPVPRSGRTRRILFTGIGAVVIAAALLLLLLG